MKLKITTILPLVAILLASCGGQSTNNEEKSTVEAAAVTYTVDSQASVVAWKGEVAGVYGHNGVINIAEGSITAEGSQITSGSIVIDMKSIQPTDSASYKDEDGRRASDLVGHLSTGDFFLVDSFPTASFLIKSHVGNMLTGDLTVRGITKEETATVNGINVENGTLKASATLVFNRQDYKVSWVHFMKDMVLSDDIAINIELTAKQ